MKHIVLFAFVALAALAALAQASFEKRVVINFGPDDEVEIENAGRISQWRITRYTSGITMGIDYGHNSVMAVPLDEHGNMIAGSQSVLIDLVTYDHDGSIINNVLSTFGGSTFNAANFPVNAKSDVSIALKNYAVPNNRVELESFTIDNASPGQVINKMFSSISDTFTDGKVYFRFDPTGNCQGLAKAVMTGLRSTFGA